MIHGKILGRRFFAALAFFIIMAGPFIGWGDKPPWSGGPGSPGDYEDPVTAPEPTALSLIVVGGVGVAGHYLANRKRKK